MKESLDNFDPVEFNKNLAHPKPGKPVKKKLSTKRILSHNIEVPVNRNCVNCNGNPEKTCHHHAESTRIKMLSGGGIMGGKIGDKLTAWLCDDKKCGVRFDTKPDRNAPKDVIDKHDLFAYDCICKTWLL